MAREHYQIPGGTVLYFEDAGVVLAFRRTDGINEVTVWRRPNRHGITCEGAGTDDMGDRAWADCHVKPLPLPGPARVLLREGRSHDG